MNNKKRLLEFNQSNILNASKELFLEKGVTQTTMDDIAKRAEYSKSTLYVYFKSKEEIYNHIVLEYFILLKKGIEDALEKAKDFIDGYFAICNTIATFYDDYPLYFESILGEINIEENDTSSTLFQIYLVGEQINDTMESYMKKSGIEGAATSQTTFILWGSICGIITLANKKEKYIKHKMNISKEEFMKNGFEFLLKSIMSK